ncbi:MAG: hypothetical protein AABW79_01765 [Nanoarchaeota archaeon]
MDELIRPRVFYAVTRDVLSDEHIDRFLLSLMQRVKLESRDAFFDVERRIFLHTFYASDISSSDIPLEISKFQGHFKVDSIGQRTLAHSAYIRGIRIAVREARAYVKEDFRDLRFFSYLIGFGDVIRNQKF